MPNEYWYDDLIHTMITIGGLILPCTECGTEIHPVYSQTAIRCSNPSCCRAIYGTWSKGVALIEWNHNNRPILLPDSEETEPTFNTDTPIEALIKVMFEYQKKVIMERNKRGSSS